MLIQEPKVFRDVRIPTSDPGVTLSADLFTPAATERVPALVTVLPYRNDAGSGIECDSTLRWFASRGYACLLVDLRGTGSSDGTQRLPFDPLETDDAVEAINWAANQPWSTGKVGMWGMSYGAIVAMRTATRQPNHLKAILAIEGMLDPERDFVHPGGSPGCLGSLGIWGAETLLNQLLPPLHDFGGEGQQRRWHDRRQSFEPWLIDLVRHGPGHPTWRSRTIDASRIAVPAFFVAGWRDLFCDATIRAYESSKAPKKLLVGPWMHTFPDASLFEPIEFRSLVLRWWDYWLKGLNTGIMEEPPVTIFVQGARPEWRNVQCWPPASASRILATGGDSMLRAVPRESEHDAKALTAIADWRSDATVGALSGLWGIPTSGFGLPIDQHDDDIRSVTSTTLKIDADTVVVGRPVVRVRWLTPGTPGRLVARLTDVDERGTSTLISMGVTSAPGAAELHEVVLNPTCYRVPAGHRLRVVLGNADFPRLWPESAIETSAELQIRDIGLQFEQLSDSVGSVTTLCSPELDSGNQSALVLHAEPIWTISRDPLIDRIKIAIGQNLLALTPNREHLLDIRCQMSAEVVKGDSRAAVVVTRSTATVRMKSGATVVVLVDTHLTRQAAQAVASITVDAKTVFTKQWDLCTADMGLP